MDRRRRMRLSIVLILTTVIVLANIWAITSRPSSAPPVILVDARSLQDSVPALSVGERQGIINLIEHNHVLRRLLSLRQYRLAGMAPWTKPSGELIGGIALLALSHPTTLKGTWASLNYKCAPNSDPPYTTALYVVERRRVSDLTLLVDLNRKTLVGIEPDPGARLDAPIHWLRTSLNTTCQQYGAVTTKGKQ